jgi:rRNA-processing protein FCF1
VGRLRLEDAVGIVREGVANVIFGLEASEAAPEAFSLAIELYGIGHRDIFDTLLYSTAVASGMIFLTLDRELAEFVKKRGLPRIVMEPEKLKVLLV